MGPMETYLPFPLAELGGESAAGVLGREIQIPSTSMPDWMARTPKGISDCFRGGGRPVDSISEACALFSASIISSLAIYRFDHHSFTKPMMKTTPMAQAKTYGLGVLVMKFWK